jgi:hypothetical protein
VGVAAYRPAGFGAAFCRQVGGAAGKLARFADANWNASVTVRCGNRLVRHGPRHDRVLDHRGHANELVIEAGSDPAGDAKSAPPGRTATCPPNGLPRTGRRCEGVSRLSCVGTRLRLPLMFRRRRSARRAP